MLKLFGSKDKREKPEPKPTPPARPPREGKPRLFGSTSDGDLLREALAGYSVPSFPVVVNRALAEMRNESTSTEAVTKLIRMDPGISVRVLAVVNSAAYSPSKRIENLNQAVVMLGMANLESLVLAVAVHGTVPEVVCEGFDATRFWLTSARRASAAKSLAGFLWPATRSESFTAGLLQDIAIPFLAKHHASTYGPVLRQWHEGTASLSELEKDALGYDHAEIAACLGAEWGLPERLVDAIANHHQDAEAEPYPAVSLVAHLKETDSEAGVDALLNAAEAKYGVPPEHVMGILEESDTKAQELGRMLA